MGYVILPNDEVALDPDEQARAVIQLVFDKFDALGTIYGLMHDLVRHGIALPVRLRGGARKGELEEYDRNLMFLHTVPIIGEAGCLSRGRVKDASQGDRVPREPGHD
jgi:hypothetical protein